MNLTLAPTNQAEIISRSFDLHADRMSPDAAEFIMSIQMDERDRKRIKELAEKARQGTLSEADETDLEEYRRAGRVMEMMKLTARMMLKNPRQ